ncbi:unnamed protein product [Sphenostylis stenocarpa]|uniref:Uncharacterized protein n=1 Tax=Sphenostylis stenocarpa TaxID=92480 RepID=A0AA86W5L6_9FABA|nr:unnamed protein product [Sphenostylis stenocarpa]
MRRVDNIESGLYQDRIVGETSQFTMPAPPLAMYMGTQLKNMDSASSYGRPDTPSLPTLADEGEALNTRGVVIVIPRVNHRGEKTKSKIPISRWRRKVGG